MSETNAVVAIFESHETSEDAIRKLQSSGFELRQLTLVDKETHGEDQVGGIEPEPKTDQYFLVTHEESENSPSVNDAPADSQPANFNPATDSPYTPDSVKA